MEGLINIKQELKDEKISIEVPGLELETQPTFLDNITDVNSRPKPEIDHKKDDEELDERCKLKRIKTEINYEWMCEDECPAEEVNNTVKTGKQSDKKLHVITKDTNKISRKDLSLGEKIALLDKIQSQLSNKSYRELGELTGVSKSTIARILLQRFKLRKEWDTKSGKTFKRARKGKDPNVDEALIQWFTFATQQGVRVNGPMLKSKSEELAREFGNMSFNATDGWLSRWKRRHEINLKKAHETCDDSSNEVWKFTTLPNLLQGFAPEDIYNGQEISLFYRMPSDEFYCEKERADRVTIFCCSNSSGCDKRKLLLIGKDDNCRSFNDLRNDGLPVVYYANRNSWMTSFIFQKWLTNWDKELEKSSRKILLIGDNSLVHFHVSGLKNIQLQFLPDNVTSSALPMETGIVKNLKEIYHRRLQNYITEKLEEQPVTLSKTAEEIRANITTLQAVQLIADSWQEVGCDTIRNCFVHCGFTVSPLGLNDHLDRDVNLQCSDNNDHLFNGKVTTKHGRSPQKQKTKEDVSTCDPVTDQEAARLVARLRTYFMQNGNEDSPMSALDTCADFIHKQSTKRTRGIDPEDNTH